MFDKLPAIEARYETLMSLISDPAVQAEPAEYRKHTKALSEIQETVDAFRTYKGCSTSRAQAEELAADPDMRELAQDELTRSARSATRSSSSSRSCSRRATPTTRRTSSSKFAPAPAARKRRCSPPTCSACIRATPSARAGSSS